MIEEEVEGKEVRGLGMESDEHDMHGSMKYLSKLERLPYQDKVTPCTVFVMY